MRIVVLTGAELRHDFVRKAFGLAEGIEVLASYREGLEKSLATVVDRSAPGADLQLRHIAARTLAERDFFGAFVDLTPDRSNPVDLPKGAINEAHHVDAIRALAPDLLVAYGCSLIKGPLLEEFAGRFVNVHLGLSPYYRGAGTNFWPLVNGEPEFVGATFMHIDAGIDTGEVIHQMRATVHPGDDPHRIGNRLIADMTATYVRLVRRFAELGTLPQVPEPETVRVYRQKDFTAEATEALYAAFADGLVDRYLAEAPQRLARAPIVENPRLVEDPAS